jgi:molecular chaperone GrpE (heat shock protein)
MESSIKIVGEFASAMQQFSAEAAKSLPEYPDEDQIGAVAMEKQIAQVLQEFRTLNGRIQNLETTLTKRLEEISNAFPAAEPLDFAQQFRKLNERVDTIRNADGVNQRLFDSLHHELIKYRDNFLRESLQKPFIRDLVVLFDDLTALSSQLETAGEMETKTSAVVQWRDNLENAIHSLVEIMHRLDVTEIEEKDTVDRAIHRVVGYEPVESPEDDGRIAMRIKRGFFWRDGVLRPEEVIAKRFSEARLASD